MVEQYVTQQASWSMNDCFWLAGRDRDCDTIIVHHDNAPTHPAASNLVATPTQRTISRP